MKKLCHKWSGPYQISEVITPLTYRLVEKDSKSEAGVHNVKNLKKFYDRPESLEPKSSKSDRKISKETIVKIPIKSNYNLRSRARQAQ